MEKADLNEKVDHVINECNEILRTLEGLLEECSSSSFRQAKEIDETIARLKRQGIPVPVKLTEMRLELLGDYGEYEHLSSLVADFHEKIAGLLTHSLFCNLRVSQNRKKKEHSKGMDSVNHEKPLGSKGNSNLEDYLIPVISLMNEGSSHTEAFRSVANGLGVREATVRSQCTRALNVSVDGFVSHVTSGKIIDLLERKYPSQVALIRRELVK